MQCKDTAKPIDAVGAELNVDFILEGTVRRDGDRVRIFAQLIQVSDQTHLWAENYEREKTSSRAPLPGRISSVDFVCKSRGHSCGCSRHR